MKNVLFLRKNDNYHWALNHILVFLILYNLFEALKKLLNMAFDFSIENVVSCVTLTLIAYSTLLILNNRMIGIVLCIVFHLLDAFLRYFVFRSEFNVLQFSIYLATGIIVNLGFLFLRKDGVSAWSHLK